MPPRTPPTPISRSCELLLADAEANLHDVERFTELGAEFHLAVAEASHNRVLVVQLISLQHVSWPRRNPTLNAKVSRRILDVHKELLALIEIRDAAGARRLMDDHVKMIRARRVAEMASAKLRAGLLLMLARAARGARVDTEATTIDGLR